MRKAVCTSRGFNPAKMRAEKYGKHEKYHGKQQGMRQARAEFKTTTGVITPKAPHAECDNPQYYGQCRLLQMPWLTNRSNTTADSEGSLLACFTTLYNEAGQTLADHKARSAKPKSKNARHTADL